MATRPLELDFAKHQFKADGPEELAKLTELLKLTGYQAPPAQGPYGAATPLPMPLTPARPMPKSPLFSEVVNKFFAAKNTLTQSTEIDYRSTAKHFIRVVGDPEVNEVGDHEISTFMESMAKQATTPRTVDKKIGAIRALLNFAIAQKLRQVESNPAAERNLLSKRQRKQGGQNPFELDQLRAVFGCDEFREKAFAEPGFYLVEMLCMSTGGRITALTQIQPHHMRKTVDEQPYIHIESDKTDAGARNIPVPLVLWNRVRDHLVKHGSFGYKLRADGKGASDAVRKDLDTHCALIGFGDERLSSHSLRKTFNDLLKKGRVPIEARCQVLGHEFENVNNSIYSTPYSIDELAVMVEPVQLRLLTAVNFVG